MQKVNILDFCFQSGVEMEEYLKCHKYTTHLTIFLFCGFLNKECVIQYFIEVILSVK